MADVTVSRAYIDNFVQALHDLDQIGRSALADALARTDLGNRNRVRAIMRVHCNTSAQAAAELSAQFYRGMSLLQTGEDVEVSAMAGWDEKATDAATDAIIAQAAGDEQRLVQGLLDRQSYELNRASKRSTYRNGKADGREVRYARVPSGAETCAWCLMTAGLGYWFMTEEAASHTHRGCDCVIVPSIGRGDVRIKGYDSTVYRDMWREANALRANGDLPQEWLDHIAGVHALRDRQGRPYRDDTNGTLYVMRKMHGLK